MRLLSAAAVLTLSLGFAGCKSQQSMAPGWQPTGTPLTTTATYDVLGHTEGTASGGVLFGFIPIGMERKVGVIHGGPPAGFASVLEKILNPGTAVKDAAIYNAIENLPDADAVMAPRVKTQEDNYVIYKKVTVAVKGHGVRYNPSAK